MKDGLLKEMNVRLRNVANVVSEVFYGLTVHELDLEMKKERGNTENLFMLIVFGDIVGLPLLPPYYSLRLFPYIIPHIRGWKRRVLREKDLTDFVSGDL